MNLVALCPVAPSWDVPWEQILHALDFVREMYTCPQDKSFHAEGDVGIHTKMACESLTTLKEWRSLPKIEREIVFLAVLMHDWGKLFCTKTESDGRISSRGHSAKGERLAREFLWRAETPFLAREMICSLIRLHQLPFFLVEKADALRRLIEVSCVSRGDLLHLVAKADALGRKCESHLDHQKILDNTELFFQMCHENHCISSAWPFSSAHSRFCYFKKSDRSPYYDAYDDTSSEVILLSGFPGVGKDTWIAKNASNLPVISLDDIRAELDVLPDESQGTVVVAARERAKELLRKKESFVWNATNTSQRIRGGLVELFARYNARIHIVYLEVTEPVLCAQNKAREEQVPGHVFTKLLDNWSIPDVTEAHKVSKIINGELVG